MKKVFRALTETACEKLWIGDDEPTPEGFHTSTRGALDAYKASPRRGRPPKSEEQAE